MSDQDYITIYVWLAGRSYRIKILPEEEDVVRKAVRVADEKITELRQHYAGKDDQDFVAMCLLMYAADHATHPTHHPAIQNEVKELISRINAVLEPSAPVETNEAETIIEEEPGEHKDGGTA